MSGRVFVIVVFLLHYTGGVSTQGVFAPVEFNQASCSGSHGWTNWFDSGDPSSTLGEFEVTTHIQQILPAFMCAVPLAIEVSLASLVRVFDKNPVDTP